MPRLSQNKAGTYSGCDIRRADVANILESTFCATRYSFLPDHAHRPYLPTPGRLLRSRARGKPKNRAIPISCKDPSTVALSSQVLRTMNSKDVRT